MPDRTLVLIRENPSLAAGLSDLFEAEGYTVAGAQDLDEAARFLKNTPGLDARPVLVVASNHHYSATVRDWKRGALSDLPLVLVGSRDPATRSRGRFHVVPLPLDVPRLLDLLFALATPSQAEVPAS